MNTEETIKDSIIVSKSTNCLTQMKYKCFII